MDILGSVIASVIVAVIAIAIVVKLLSWLYLKSSGDTALVRTGFGGSKVVLNGGVLVVPVLHQTTPVNMNTLRLEVRRVDQWAVQTRDSMRVNVQAAFYVHVAPDKAAILRAAATLGAKTLDPDELRNLVEGKFVDALRASAAEADMRELHEKRGEFVRRVAARVREDLTANGLELESVSLIEFDQTSKEFFNPQNAFDAEGLTRLSRDIEERRRTRNEIERDTEVAIRRKALDVEAQQLEIDKAQLAIEREAEYARLTQKQEIAFKRAQHGADVAREEADRKRQSEEAQIDAAKAIEAAGIVAHQDTERRRIESEKALAQARIATEREVKELELRRAEALDLVAIGRSVAVQLAEQDREIEFAHKSKARAAVVAEAEASEIEVREQVERAEIATRQALAKERLASELDVAKRRIASEAELKQAETAKALAVETAQIERQKSLELAEHDRVIAVATKAKERHATVSEADKARAEAAGSEQAVATARDAAIADGKRKVADIEAERARVMARGEADAADLRLAAEERKQAVEAAATRARCEAENQLSPEQVAMKVKLATLERLPAIIHESAKPMQEIDRIEIIQVEGLGSANANGSGTGAIADTAATPPNFAEQMMTSALRYRAQAPVVDAVLEQVGLNGASLAGLAKSIAADLPTNVKRLDAGKPATGGE
jgi:uncharacterized membrane protein YqiK